jgi:1-phosphofructokinase family hexose kinase
MTVHTLGLTPALDIVYVLPHVGVGDIHRPETVIRSAGGKSLNVARALARLGTPVSAIVPLGGHIGELVASLLAESGVDADVVTTDRETRMCVTACDTGGRTLTEFYERVESLGAPLSDIAVRIDAVPAGEWLTVSGAVPAGTDAAAFADVLAGASARGVRLAVDVHGPALGAILELAHPALVKVNRLEAAELTGVEEVRESARLLRLRGAGVAVVTDGEAGSFAVSDDGEVVQPPVADPGLFAVGSGDCFLAGVVSALDRARPLEDALALGARAAAANARQPGGAVFDLD